MKYRLTALLFCLATGTAFAAGNSGKTIPSNTEQTTQLKKEKKAAEKVEKKKVLTEKKQTKKMKKKLIVKDNYLENLEKDMRRK